MLISSWQQFLMEAETLAGQEPEGRRSTITPGTTFQRSLLFKHNLPPAWGISGSWEALRQNTDTVSEQLHPRAAGELSADTGLTQAFGSTEGRQRQTRTHDTIECLGSWSVNRSKNLEISRQKKKKPTNHLGCAFL